MSESKKINVFYKDRTYDIQAQDIGKLESLKEFLTEGFNINRNEVNLKVFFKHNEGECTEILDNEEYKNLLENFSDKGKIILEVTQYDDLIKNLALTESLKLDKTKNQLNSSVFSLASLSDSMLVKGNEERVVQEVDQKEDKQIELVKDYHIVLMKEVEEAMDQFKAKFEIQSQLCGMCPFPPSGARYFCMFCEDMILCENCEMKHIHPVVKFNSKDVKTKNEIRRFISNANESELKPSLTANIRNSFIVQTFNSAVLHRNTLAAKITFPQNDVLTNPNTSSNIKIRLTN